MRKLTASVLATALLAGGAVTGAALAAPAAAHHAHPSGKRVAKLDRSEASSRDRLVRAADHDLLRER